MSIQHLRLLSLLVVMFCARFAFAQVVPVQLVVMENHNSQSQLATAIQQEVNRPVVISDTLSPGMTDRLEISLPNTETVIVRFVPSSGPPIRHHIVVSSNDQIALAVWLATSMLRRETLPIVNSEPSSQQLPVPVIVPSQNPSEPSIRQQPAPSTQPRTFFPALTRNQHAMELYFSGGIAVTGYPHPIGGISIGWRYNAFNFAVEGRYGRLPWLELVQVGVTVLGVLEASWFSTGFGGGLDLIVSRNSLTGGPTEFYPHLRTNVRMAIHITQWLDFVVDPQLGLTFGGYPSPSFDAAIQSGLRIRLGL